MTKTETDCRTRRLKKVALKYAAVLAAGVGYYVFVTLTGWGLPCVFHEITGLQCPSCGVTRMFESIFHLDFKAAYGYNPFLFITAPVILFCFLHSDVKYVRNGDGTMGKLKAVLWVEIGLALCFGILRNII